MKSRKYLDILHTQFGKGSIMNVSNKRKYTRLLVLSFDFYGLLVILKQCNFKAIEYFETIGFYST